MVVTVTGRVFSSTTSNTTSTVLSLPSIVTVTPLSRPFAPRTSSRRVFSPLSRTLDQSG